MGTEYFLQIVIECDECPSVIDGEHHPPTSEEIKIPQHENELITESEWRDSLEDNGWDLKDDGRALCPKCAGKTELEKEVEEIDQ